MTEAGRDDVAKSLSSELQKSVPIISLTSDFFEGAMTDSLPASCVSCDAQVAVSMHDLLPIDVLPGGMRDVGPATGPGGRE